MSSPPPGAPAEEIKHADGGAGEGPAHVRNGAALSGSRIEEEQGVRIICVGLMRTGLKTLHKALRVLGHENIYDQEQIVSTFEQWDDIMHNKVQADTFASIFQGTQVAMGMPTFCFWEQILEVYPDAKVILTIRDEDDWFRSLQKAKTMMDNDMPGAPLCHGSLMLSWERFLVPSYHKFCDVLRFAWSVTLGGLPMRGDALNEVIVRSSYRKHNTYVQSQLRDKKTAKGERQLLVYNVREGWKPLCDFLGIDRPAEEFPVVMEVPYFPGQLVSKDAHSHPADVGQEFENLLMPESDFGMHVRRELRRGLIVGFVLLTLLVVPVLALLRASRQAQGFLALAYLVLLAIAWEAYVVMHTVVMRVPALVVLPTVMKSLFIAGGLQACFITYAFLKEQIVTQDHVASQILILSARLMSVISAAVAMVLFEGGVSFAGVPPHKFFWFGLTNEASTWAGYEMLKYVSFPVQVMAKSCKLLPTMLMGKALNGDSYTWLQYGQAVAAMFCVTLFHVSGGHKEGKGGKKGGAADDDDMSDWLKAACGIFFLIIFFVSDSFTSQWQTALYKKHPGLTKMQMMLGGNVIGLCITLVSAASQWGKVSSSMAMVLANPQVLVRVLLLGLSASLGQFCIYTAIKVLGPLAFTWIMTIRQLMSVLISLVWFGHGVSVIRVMCILTVFAIMSSKQLAKAGPAIKKCAKCSARSGTKDPPLECSPGNGKRSSAQAIITSRASQMWGTGEAPGGKKEK